tara:strand:+ start:590 stop:829 length:240 start_codon:yes stop_codon:yes gene_type:complete
MGMGFLDAISLLGRRDYHNFGRYYEHSLREEMAKKAAEDARKNTAQPDLVHPTNKRTLLESLPAISPMQNALTPPQSHR